MVCIVCTVAIWSVGVEIEILLLLNMADMDRWKNVG